MPTKAVAAETMGVGKKEGGKHWTKAQVEARQKAEHGFKRESSTTLRVPDWLNDEARVVWYRVIKAARGLDLYDMLDTDTLAVYCDAVAQYKEMTAKREKKIEDIKAMQSQARIVHQYADKLGLTPQSRARLIKRRADEIQDEFGNEFD